MITHNLSFSVNDDRYHYDANGIQAYKNDIAIRLDEFTKAYDTFNLKEAFQALMGVNGDKFIEEIKTSGKLSDSSYAIICDNTKYNSKESIIKYFGVVQYYYLQGHFRDLSEIVSKF